MQVKVCVCGHTLVYQMALTALVLVICSSTMFYYDSQNYSFKSKCGFHRNIILISDSNRAMFDGVCVYLLIHDSIRAVTSL